MCVRVCVCGLEAGSKVLFNSRITPKLLDHIAAQLEERINSGVGSGIYNVRLKERRPWTVFKLVYSQNKVKLHAYFTLCHIKI